MKVFLALHAFKPVVGDFQNQIMNLESGIIRALWNNKHFELD